MFDSSLTDNQPIERGCGTRVKGGVYIETMTGPNGHPVECFIKDPPLTIDVEAIGLSHIGCKIIEQVGVSYIFDWVGEGYYPNVTDFIEEVRRFGASRRMPNAFAFERLSPQSKLVLVHSRAKYELTEDMREIMSQGHLSQLCPRLCRCLHDNTPDELIAEMFRHSESQCARHWWYDIDAPKDTASGQPTFVTMPSFTYKGVTKVEQPEYKPGIFMVLPIHRVVVVRDEENEDRVNETVERIESKLTGTIPLEIVDN